MRLGSLTALAAAVAMMGQERERDPAPRRDASRKPAPSAAKRAKVKAARKQRRKSR